MICPICGFHNEPQAEACGSCGQPLTLGSAPADPAGATAAGVPDPSAVTRTVAAPSTPCWNCGVDNDPTRTFCQACGQQLRSTGRRWRPRGRRSAVVAAPRSDDERRRRYAALAGLGALALVLLTVAAVVGGLLGDKRAALPDGSPVAGASVGVPGGPSPEASAVEGTPALTGGGPTDDPVASGAPSASSAGGARFRCEPQSQVAPAAGAWQVFGARYGDRGQFDYLQLNLRRRGGSEETAGVSAEIVPLADVESRFGVAPPDSGDLALVVAFDGPVRLSGQFGRRPNQRALREFRLIRTSSGTAAILGVTAPGCFELLAPGWSDGEGGRAAVVVNVER